MDNYLELIDLMDYPSDYKVTLAIAWVHPHNLPKKLIELGKFDNGFYKMPDWYTNYTYINGDKLEPPVTVPVIDFRDDLFIDNVEITDLILSNYQGSLPSEAFKGMKNLKRIWLPKSIKYIPKDCFKDCKSLEEIYFEGSKEEFKQIKTYYKLYRVIHKLGPKDDVEEYYDYGNLSFMKSKVYYNQVRNKESIKEYFLKIGKTNITRIMKDY